MSIWYDIGRSAASQIWNIWGEDSNVDDALNHAQETELLLPNIPYDKRKKWEEGFRNEWNELIIESEIEICISL